MCLDYTYSQNLKEPARDRHLVSILILIFILNSIGNYKSEISDKLFEFLFSEKQSHSQSGKLLCIFGAQ